MSVKFSPILTTEQKGRKGRGNIIKAGPLSFVNSRSFFQFSLHDPYGTALICASVSNSFFSLSQNTFCRRQTCFSERPPCLIASSLLQPNFFFPWYFSVLFYYELVYFPTSTFSFLFFLLYGFIQST